MSCRPAQNGALKSRAGTARRHARPAGRAVGPFERVGQAEPRPRGGGGGRWEGGGRPAAGGTGGVEGAAARRAKRGPPGASCATRGRQRGTLERYEPRFPSSAHGIPLGGLFSHGLA